MRNRFPTPRLVASLIALGCVLLGGRPASAEWIADLFVGPTFTRSQDVKVDSTAGRGVFRDVDFDTAISGGVRVGRYFDAIPFLGVAVDGFLFYPNIGTQSTRLDGCFVLGGCGTRQGGTGSYDVTTAALSFDVMLRAPLFKRPENPNGLVQPYITAGVPLYLTTIDPRHSRWFRNHDSDTDVSIGYMVSGGVAVEVYKALAVFVEYRFNHVSVDADLRDSVSASRATLRTDINSHSTLIGVSARW